MIAFIVENIQTICLIYAIGASVVFIGVMIFFAYICKAEDEEREHCSDDYSQENAAGSVATMCIGAVIAFGCALLWWTIPILIIALIFMYVISRTHRNIMGNMAEDKEETEE